MTKFAQNLSLVFFAYFRLNFDFLVEKESIFYVDMTAESRVRVSVVDDFKIDTMNIDFFQRLPQKPSKITEKILLHKILQRILNFLQHVHQQLHS